MTIRRWGDVETLGTIDDTPGFNGSQKGYDIGALTDGGYVITGIDDFGTAARPDDRGHFQVFDANGTAVTGMIDFTDPALGPVLETQVTGLSNGNFAVVFTTIGSDGRTDMYFDIRQPDGSLVTRETYYAGGDSNQDPAIVAYADGFAISYTYQGQLWIKSFNLDGTTDQDFLEVAEGNPLTDPQIRSSMALDNEGDTIAIAWTDGAPNGEVNAIRYRLYDTNLAEVTAELTVTTEFSSNNALHQVVAQDEDEFALAFSRRIGDSSDIMVANFEVADYGERLVNINTAESQVDPTAVGLSDGSTIVAWNDFGFGTRAKIMARDVLGNNLPDGDQERLDLPNEGLPSGGLRMVELADGRVATVWFSGGELHHQILDNRDGTIDGNDLANEIYGNKQLADQIVGYSGDDRLLGLAGDDSLYGGADNDVLYGNNGDDAMYGGTGNDILAGGRGADIHDGGAGVDTAYYLDATSGVTASLANNQINSGWADGDTWFDVENLTGSNFDDYLYGQAGGLANTIKGGAGDDVIKGYSGNDRLYGNADDDILDGGLGADLLSGGSGIDIASYEGATTGVTAALANTSLNSGEADGDSYFGIEGLRGSRYNDILNGSNGDNILEGWAGNDLLKGYRGFDTLTGGGGVDRFIFATGPGAGSLATITDFQEGVDKIRLFDEAFDAMGAFLSAGEFRSNRSGQAQDSNDHIIYNEANGYLYYDEDGAGGSGRVYFAKLDAGLDLSHTDFEIV